MGSAEGSNFTLQPYDHQHPEKAKLAKVQYCIDITFDLLTKLMGPHLWDSAKHSHLRYTYGRQHHSYLTEVWFMC